MGKTVYVFRTEHHGPRKEYKAEDTKLDDDVTIVKDLEKSFFHGKGGVAYLRLRRKYIKDPAIYIFNVRGYRQEYIDELAKYCQCGTHYDESACSHCAGCLRQLETEPLINGYVFPRKKSVVEKTELYRKNGGVKGGDFSYIYPSILCLGAGCLIYYIMYKS